MKRQFKRKKSTRRRLSAGIQHLDARLPLAGDMQSPYQPLDANLDTRVTVEDIYALQELIESEESTVREDPVFPDVNGSGHFSLLDILVVINHHQDTVVAAQLVNDSSIAETTNFDLITNDPSLEIWASGFLDELELTINEQRIANLAQFESDGRLLLTGSTIDQLLTEPLPDGDHQIQVAVPGKSQSIDFVISVDRVAPQAVLDSDGGRLRIQSDHLGFHLTEPLALESFETSGFKIVALGDGATSGEIAVESFQLANDRLTVRTGQRLFNGVYQVSIPSQLCDLAGNVVNQVEFPLQVLQTATLSIDPVSQFVTVNSTNPTVSVQWDVAVQQAVAITSPGPTIASRAYAMLHTAMYNAWSAYDAIAISTDLNDDLQRPESENNDENKAEAMSFAGYRILVDLFPAQQPIFEDLMTELGYDPTNDSTDVSTPAGIGNVSAAGLLAIRHADGANQLGDSPEGDGTPYSNTTAYTPTNSPGDTANIVLWTPERVPIDSTEQTLDHVQEFLTPHWGDVEPFALASPSQFRPDAPQAFLLVAGSVDFQAKTVTLEDGTELNIDRSLIGSVINPGFIDQAQRVIDASASLTDEQKLIAEFWEDAKDTSFPPGTWMTFGQFVSGRDEHSLDEDAKLFLALSNAIFDASIATWEAKVFYDYVRPVRAIRELGELGLIGQFNAALGGHAISAWTPDTGTTEVILASEFLTYQTPGGDPSPPFAEYTSGHSTFSAAGATILEWFTESSGFGGEVAFEIGESRFEPGQVPAAPVTLQWETFRQAADEAGLSRIYGGIHFDEGDLHGRSMGNQVAELTWSRAQQLFSGNTPTS